MRKTGVKLELFFNKILDLRNAFMVFSPNLEGENLIELFCVACLHKIIIANFQPKFGEKT